MMNELLTDNFDRCVWTELRENLLSRRWQSRTLTHLVGCVAGEKRKQQKQPEGLPRGNQPTAPPQD